MDLARPITLHLPKRVEVGQGTAAQLGLWAKGFDRVLVLCSRSTQAMIDQLGLSTPPASHVVPPEPKDKDLAAAIDTARKVRPDLIVGLGGGSVMDIAKLVAVLWGSDHALSNIGGADKVTARYSAIAQVPTTAGTGSEGGIRALFTSTDTGMKVAVESALMLADLAILDPDLTMGMPPAITAATGVDALAHCVEGFTSKRSHPLIDGYARQGIALTGRYLARAVQDGSDPEARSAMLLASFYGGLCLGPVNTTAGHAVAYPLGTHAGLPHGLANALVFPHVLAFNAPAAPEKTAEIVTSLGARSAEATVDWCRSLGIDMSLKSHGISDSQLSAFAKEAHGIRRLMDWNPREASVADIEAIYRAAY
ncbi:iron-containing alcohol dehydrogenase [Loktanella sp. SALINAS62]|uniref:iron-containing alcohol dehydrogenase n=1 Tax=Loktanella sp. SALINAS62 TaxID=2706124 RepID=UPI001B8D2E55|nr:iron-containing alcohol dehydrogenase [Loktanella sp. SALINAS62]MBS1302662.1 iron-containing alcohol dehydrogenase [Loktanella sp. SALINAS62]